MAPKRPFKDQSHTTKVSKRHKPTPSTETASSRSTAYTKPIPIDELNWSAVTLPDRFEDAEGFFGLEEIEGVEVVRVGGEGGGEDGRDGGKVQYKVLKIPHWDHARSIAHAG